MEGMQETPPVTFQGPLPHVPKGFLGPQQTWWGLPRALSSIAGRWASGQAGWGRQSVCKLGECAESKCRKDTEALLQPLALGGPSEGTPQAQVVGSRSRGLHGPLTWAAPASL